MLSGRVRKALPSDEDREEFKEMMDLCRVYASDSSNATNPIIFELMVTSIVLCHQKKLYKIERKINTVLKERNGEISLETGEEKQVGKRN